MTGSFDLLDIFEWLKPDERRSLLRDIGNTLCKLRNVNPDATVVDHYGNSIANWEMSSQEVIAFLQANRNSNVYLATVLIALRGNIRFSEISDCLIQKLFTNDFANNEES